MSARLTRADIRNLIRILYGESPNKLYSVSERDELANKLTALREKAPRESPNRHTIGERSICRRCDLEIEFHGKRTWLDRGGNWTCASDSRKHQPNSLQGQLLEAEHE